MKIFKGTLLAIAIGAVAAHAGDTLATVNGVKITTDDADRFMRALAPGKSFDTVDKKSQKSIVDRLIERELFYEAAKKAGVDKEEAFQKALNIAKHELMINQWMKDKFDSVVVSDSEAKEFYDKNKERFTKPAQVHARHILVKTEKEAQGIIDQLKGLSGEKLKNKFIELAKSKSTGPTGKNGGDLGTFVAGQMVKPFSDAAFALKKGEITLKPVKTQFGYHVIYIEDKKDASAVPYKEAKAQILNTLKQKQFTDMIKSSSDKLRKEAKVELNTK